MNSPDPAEARELQESIRGWIEASIRDALSPAADAPLTAEDLQARGYSQKEAYILLHRHGRQLPRSKRYRIARSVLEEIERGDREP